MERNELRGSCRHYLEVLCEAIPERCVGSSGNRKATEFFRNEVSSLGWNTEVTEFDAVDWDDGGASLRAGGSEFQVHVSPYSLGCDVSAELVSVSSTAELVSKDIRNRIVLLHGDIAAEQLMPKNFVFYNPEEHRKIISLLESKEPRAIVAATGRNPSLAGGVYPFPLIEDGDFDVPSVYMTEEEGKRLLPFAGSRVTLRSSSRRIPGRGFNVTASRGGDRTRRIVLTAHIDAKKGTPGAIDNATGVTALLLLAGLLAEYDGDTMVEMVALNGEDYFSVPGQMLYVDLNRGRFSDIILNINIDGMGYREGDSAFSFYGLPEYIHKAAVDVMSEFDGIVEGRAWPQGDHGLFIQNGCPAIAVSSMWFTENIDSQDITHTPRDNMEIADCSKVTEVAEALGMLVRRLSRT